MSVGAFSHAVVSIVVTYNGEKWVEKCLQSLRDSETPTDVLIIDNASSDRTTEIIQQQFPEMTLIQSTENLGFGAANNLGIQTALERGYAFFFLLNQDAWVEPDTLTSLCESLENNPEYGIVSPVHLNGKATALDKNFEWYMREEMVPGLLDNLNQANPDQVLYQVPFVNAAAWMISKGCLLTVGKFHPLFHHYGEDDNYAQRVLASGYQIGVLTSVSIYHDREFREVPVRKDEFEKKISKNLRLYVFNPLIDFSVFNTLIHTRKIIKRYRRETNVSYIKSLWLGYKTMIEILFLTRRKFDLSFR